MEYNRIICGDALEIMKSMTDKSVDLCLTDPPYNAKSIGPKHRKYAGGIMQSSPPGYRKFCESWFKEARRISKTLVFTPGIANTHFYPQPNWQICWHKPASVSFNRMGGFNAWEPIFVYGKTAKGKRLGQDYLLYNTLNFKKGIESDHPCPKNPDLWGRLVDIFSNQGDLVFDPMMGSGTTAVVAKKLKRNYLGIEIIKSYCEMAEKRINAVNPLGF